LKPDSSPLVVSAGSKAARRKAVSYNRVSFLRVAPDCALATNEDLPLEHLFGAAVRQGPTWRRIANWGLVSRVSPTAFAGMDPIALPKIVRNLY
jgi:hypothetical protein